MKDESEADQATTWQPSGFQMLMSSLSLLSASYVEPEVTSPGGGASG